MHRWQGQPPAGADRLPAAPLALGDNPLAYARNAGGTVAPDGSRRELCAPTAYRLIRGEVPPRTGGPACPWCTSPLWTIADLDTGSPEVAEALAHTFHAHSANEGGSTLGGHPAWIREAVDFGEGGYYLYLHTPCGLAAVAYGKAERRAYLSHRWSVVYQAPQRDDRGTSELRFPQTPGDR